MSWGRLLVAALLAVSLASGTAPGPVRAPAAQAGPLRQVVAGEVAVLVPRDWDVRPLASPAAPRQGLAASLEGSPAIDPSTSPEVIRWRRRPQPQFGLRAYWLNAVNVQVPSDYYYLAARGTALERPFAIKACESHERRVLADHRPVFDRRLYSAGDFVAMAAGTCRVGEVTTRWASFVAAPGYGPVREVGIPESGLYYAVVVMPDGPQASARVRDVLMQVSFGGTTVSEFLRVAQVGQRH
ncbi:MAG: hypothetical protein ACRDIX_07005 [Actinomycetota bacterium]